MRNHELLAFICETIKVRGQMGDMACLTLIQSALESKRPELLKGGTPVDTQEILTAGELAAVLKVCKRTVTRQAHKGVIPFLKVGASYRFILADVMDAMERESERQRLFNERLVSHAVEALDLEEFSKKAPLPKKPDGEGTGLIGVLNPAEEETKWE
jgi:excisionase family DNA binding protein